MTLPEHIHENIAESLTDIGLNPGEITVFLCLLEIGNAERVSTIAKKTSLNRTTLYGVLKSLVKRGLVSGIEEGGVLRYQAIRAELLADHIERLREKLATHVRKVKDAASLIERSRDKRERTYPSIQFFEGREGIRKVFEDTITGNPSKVIYGFSGTDATYKIAGVEWIMDYIRRRAKAGIMRHEIAIDSEESRKSKARDRQELRETKILPPGYHFDVEVSMYENKVLIVSFSEDYPVAVLIEDEKIAEVMRELFRYIDNTLEKTPSDQVRSINAEK